MLATARTFTLDGIEARPMRVEVDAYRGLPAFLIEGLPDSAVSDSRERVRAALGNCGFELPLQRIVANLAPAGLRRHSPGLDLPLAVALLVASGQLEWWERLPRVALVGELALDGSLRPVPGVLSAAEAARERGMEAIIVPAENGAEAALVDGLEVIALESLAQVALLAAGDLAVERPEPLSLAHEPSPYAPDLADLRGQPHVRHALEVAAAGGHRLLLVGPPGAGKSFAASRLPSILPPPTEAERLEIARVASAYGRLDQPLTTGRPFRAPHHSISTVGLLGGGRPNCPGEATRAHRGVLFLDDLGEFRRDVLEGLRAPMKCGWVQASRGGRTSRLPARFQLIAAANPCPCGRGEEDPECSCSPLALHRYRSRLGSALSERIDITVAVDPPAVAEISGPPGETSAGVRERVVRARERQEARLGAGRCNAEMTPGEARDCALTEAAAALLARERSRGRLSGSAYNQVLRLAQTLVDLAGGETIERAQLAQALELKLRKRG